ncbi:MAG: hypothetical protein KIS66_09455 [Fimbriimonadaceae bacterium]|nr:hypothetical protein [Fimbriimonadaceae bacterium]
MVSISVLCAVAWLVSPEPVSDVQNLPPNGSFETVAEGNPVGWRRNTWAGQAVFAVETKGARDGERCVSVASDGGADAGWSVRAQVLPYARYRLTGWIKTENIVAEGDRGALLNLHSRDERTPPIQGTHDWTRVETTFDTTADDLVEINCLIGYHGTAKGKAWFDDLRLELLGQREIAPRVVVDAAQTGPPISKYLYSQFIEHLGRCIYGGIWAEMLEDRKFFYPVGDDRSPWKALPGATVTMAAKDAFVGEHSPVATGGGFSQAGLHLVRDKEYVGRIWLKGRGPAKVSLIWGNEPGERETVNVAAGGGYALSRFRFRSPLDTKTGRLEISGPGPFTVGTVSLMPADNVKGMRADVLALLKQLDAPLYRWPGGNFVSGYEWRDGLGDPDRRPPRRNPAWTGVEHNDFGTHEFLAFCEAIGTEPLIVVNAGFGDSYSAAQWLEYVNGAPNTPMGRERAKNGRRDPWNVAWWGIGNEMYGNWQLGHMSLDQYVVKHNDFAARMRKVDPKIRIIAVGEVAWGGWSQGMLTRCADAMELLSEHFYVQERPSVPAHVAQVPAAIKRKADLHRELRKTLPSLQGKNIKIAMDEWNYWYGPHVFGELGTRYFVKDGLGIAAGLHEFYRNTDVYEMAQYAQTVNVIGCIKTTPTKSAFETTGLVLKLYRKVWGTIPCLVGGAPEPLDVAAALTADRKALTLGIVNPTALPQTLRMELKGLAPAFEGTRWTIGDPDPQAYNDPESPDRIVVRESPFQWDGSSISVEPYAVTVIKVALRP